MTLPARARRLHYVARCDHRYRAAPTEHDYFQAAPPLSNASTHQAQFNPLAALAAWLVPGLGHMLIGERRRGTILMSTILALWLAGTLIGGISVFDRVQHQFWYLGQMLIAPSIVLEITHNHVLREGPGIDPDPRTDPVFQPSYGRVNEQGVLYTALAGLLNLLAIIDVVYREPGPRRPRLEADPVSPAEPADPADPANPGSGGAI